MDMKIIMVLIVVVVVALVAVMLMTSQPSGPDQGGFVGPAGPTSPFAYCAPSPVNELLVKMQQSQPGLAQITENMCFMAGEELDDESLTDKIASIDSVTFACGGAVCSGGPLTVTSSTVRATGDAVFRVKAECENGACELTVIDGGT